MSGHVSIGFHKAMTRLLVATVVIYVVIIFAIVITVMICNL